MPVQTESTNRQNSTVRVDDDVSLDTTDVEDVLAMIGPTCDQCGADYEHAAYLTRGSRGRRLSTRVVGRCPECDHEHAVMTGVEIRADFDVEVA